MPDNLAWVVGGDIENTKDNNKTEARLSARSTGVISSLLIDEGTKEEDSNGAGSSNWQAKLLWDHLNTALNNLDPGELDWPEEELGWDVEGDQADHNAQPQQEWNKPAKVGAVQNETCNPPAVVC